MNVGKRSKLANATRVGEPEEDERPAERERDPVTGRIIGTLNVVKMPELKFLSNRLSWELKR